MKQVKNRPFNITQDAGMHIAAVPYEDDELIQAIESDRRKNATFSLSGDPDVDGITEFWTSVQRDLKKDPNWYTFAND